MNFSEKDSLAAGCDLQRIQDFLDSDHYHLQETDLIAHLNVCASCRDNLEALAGEPKHWEQASMLLRTQEFDQASRADFSAATNAGVDTTQPVVVTDVLNQLVPSEYPNHLGRLGTYEVTGVIGVGGMGVVLKAIDPSLDRVVAVKVMSPKLAHNESARKRFAREAKAAAAVLHPNVIPIHSVSSGSTLPFLVMAYIRGGSLQKRLDQDGPLPLVEVLRIGSQIASGLAAAHEQGLVHRDIKPENILLEEGVERVTITDFGLARSVDDNTITQMGSIAGTPQYMSPEQARGEQLDQQSDLFSLGSLLYALCTGRPPFRDDTSYGVMRKIIDEVPASIRQISPEIPIWMTALIEKLMAKKKEDRFATAKEVHTMLDACISHIQQPSSNPIPSKLISYSPPTIDNLPKRRRVVSPLQPRLLFPLLTGVCAMFTISALLLWMTGSLGLLVQDHPANREKIVPAGSTTEPSTRSDDANIQGKWRVVFSEDSGRSAPPEALRDILFVITKDTMTMEVGGRKQESIYKLEPSTSPKSIDLTTNGQTKPGIYDLQGDTLRICLSEKSNVRPTAFDSQPDSVNDVVLIMKRIKPEEASSANTDDHAHAGPMSPKLARSLIPAAASISIKDFQKLQTNPSSDAIQNKSLSLVLLTLDVRDRSPEEASDFRFLVEGFPHPSKIAAAMSPSRSKGYYSIIQPDYITECQITTSTDEFAQGKVTFNAPKLYIGSVVFESRKRGGTWRIEKFHLPSHKISIVLGDDGTWNRQSEGKD